MPITALPTPPSRGSNPATFSDDADAFLGALPAFGTEANDLATEVNTSVTAASNSASAASTSASAASTSATNSANSATASAGSATTAAGHATTASGHATAASSSATAAAGSASAAASSAADADADAIVAANQASNASTYATNSANSATAAAGSATAASGSASAASSSASAASTSATNAATSATNAATSASNAASSASAASTSASAAAASATSAVNAPGTSATSTTSNTIGTGSKTFTIQTGKAFVVGQFLIAANTVTPSNYMVGQITAHDTGTGSITLNVTDIGGSGTFTAWTLGLTAFSGAGDTIIDDGSITNAKLANMAQATIKGRAAGAGTGAPTDLSPAQVKTLLAIANTDVSGLGTLATQNGTFSGTSSGTNTGDQTNITGNAGSATVLQTAVNIDGVPFNGSANITVIAPGIHAATAKTTLADADEFGIVDTEAVNVLKRITWTNIKAAAKTYFDTLYQPLSTALTNLGGVSSNGLLTRTASNTYAARTITGGGGITVTDGNGVSGNPTLSVSNLKTLWIPAAAIRPSFTGGCAALAGIATSANRPDIVSLNFDATTAEYAQFTVAFPKSWDEGTITARFHWSHAATTTNFGVAWNIQGVAVSDDDTIGVAYGTAITVTDTGGTTDDLYISSTSGAITIAGTPAVGDQVYFRVYRDPANGSDTMAIDARLIGVSLFYTINTLDDA